MNPCSISVVMPAYNAERTISLAIESVLSQTYADFELVICNDASTDRTCDVVRSFADQRIRLLDNPINRGEGHSRDRAIGASRGHWITALDADDAFAPERLATLVEIARHHPGDLIADAILDCHDTLHGLVPWKTVWPRMDGIMEMDFSAFMRMERLLIQPLIERRLIVESGAVHGSRANGADMDFFLSLFAHGAKLVYVPQPMYFYRMTPGSMSTSNPQRHQLYRQVFEEARPKFAGDGVALHAIEQRITSIKRLETYQRFLVLVLQKRWMSATQYAFNYPWVLPEFFMRLIRRIPFYVHRRIHAGATRVAR